MKKILSGNEAIARAAFEAGVRVAAAYPGTPSTEILEEIAHQYKTIHAEWTPNEKVALEVAAGASYGGARSLAVMKHVGVNVAADPLMTLPYTYIRGGLVLVSADDPELFSSQNEQDNRNYAKFAKIPMLEPSNSQEAKDFTVSAFAISEAFNTPVMLRTTTRVSHSQCVVELGQEQKIPKPVLEKHPREWVMLPANARRQHPVIEARILKLKELSNTHPYNVTELNDKSIGIISSGIAYQYAKEAMPSASFLKLGFSYPMPDELIRKFAASVKELWVIEELDPFIEEHVKALGIFCHGKDHIPMYGELNPDIIKEAVLGKRQDQKKNYQLPARPPNMCPGCPHRGILWALKKNKCFIAGDIGCYTLGFLKPLEAIDTCLCMGAGINHAHGLSKVYEPGDHNIAAVIGDSTFFHSGITGVLNLAYNRGVAVIVILDNRTTAMTGAQDHPGTGITLGGERTVNLDIEKLVRSLGIEWVKTVNPYAVKETRKTVKEAIDFRGPAVIISAAPCILLKSKKATGKPLTIDQEKCNKCKVCLSLGCPAIEMRGEDIHITSACAGCNMCVDLCASGAIGGGK